MNEERYEDILKRIKMIIEEYENAGIVNVIETEIFLMLTGLHNLLQSYDIALARTEELKKKLKGNIDQKRLGVQAMAEFQSVDGFVEYMTWRARHIRNFMMEELRWPRIKTEK